MRTFITFTFASLLLIVFYFPIMASAQTCPPGQVPIEVVSPTNYSCSLVTGVNTSVTQTTGVNTSGQSVKLINPLKSGTSLESFLLNILQFVIRLGSIVVILMLVFVGYKFVAAQGSDTKLVEARKMLLWTVIGALILLGSQAIALSIKATVQAITG